MVSAYVLAVAGLHRRASARTALLMTYVKLRDRDVRSRGCLLLATLCASNVLAASGYDGRYSGERTIVRGAPPTCPKNGSASWRISNGALEYRFWAGPIPVSVAADGTLKGQIQYRLTHGHPAWASVQGKIVGTSLEADSEWNACRVHYSLKKQGG